MARERVITVSVNGQRHESAVAPRLLLCDYLRDNLGLTGTHVACSVGTCGSCTILLDGRPVRSCLLLAVQADQRTIRTVEALGEEKKLHPVQQAFHENHALQCGFCTPGLLISIAEFLERNVSPTNDEILEVLGGHLCRCTGYQNILLAVKVAAERMATARAAEVPLTPPPA
jgi:carbon-monoxide dehydrogenase small subunit